MRRIYLLGLVMMIFEKGFDQTTLYLENFGTTAGVFPAGWTSSNTTNGFASVTTSASSGYAGASGSVNARLINSGANGVVHTLNYANNLSTVGFTSITVLWGGRATATFTQPVIFEWSPDGVIWNAVSYGQVTNNATWALVNAGVRIALPPEAEGLSNLRFRWSVTSNNSGNYQIDDFSVKGIIAVPLPVSLQSFTGCRDGNKNQLRWTTSSEHNNNGFYVQRSFNGVNYISIGFVNSIAADGNSGSPLSYFFTDNGISGVKQYYRLRQVDIDGREKMSQVILIKGDHADILSISSVFPSPVHESLTVEINAPQRDNITLVFIDLNGKELKRQHGSVETGSNSIVADISNFPAGIYFVRVTSLSDATTSIAFVKK